MTSLVTLEEARDQVSLTAGEADQEINRVAELATGLVMGYVGLTDPATGAARNWTDATVPDPVKAGILLMVAEIWAHRGDETSPLTEAWELSPRVTGFLRRHIDPVVG